ncbi:hypothetical protein D9M72_429110 [compost metagenome]
MQRGQLAPEGGVVEQPPAVVGRLLRGDLRHLGQLLAQHRAVGAAALELQQVLGIGPALAFVADAVLRGHAHVLEEDLVHFLLPGHGAVQRRQRRHRDAGRMHVEQQERDAFLPLRLAAGAHQAEHPVGPLRMRGPDLGAVQDVVLAVAVGAGIGAQLQ